MRWKGLIAFIVILAVITVISLFFMDKWIESGLEAVGQSLVKARVEIDGLDFRLMKLGEQAHQCSAAPDFNVVGMRSKTEDFQSGSFR